MDSDLVVTGKDKFYTRAYGYGALNVDYPADGISLSERCARHITCVKEFCSMYEGEAGLISLGNLPSYDEIIDQGIGHFLKDPQ